MTDQPSFNRDGYPTDETLQAIRDWDPLDAGACLDFVKAAWYYPERATHKKYPEELLVIGGTEGEKYLRLSTGWSGDESLVSALNENVVITALTWRLSARGGLHIYEYPKKGKQDDRPAE